VRVESQKIHRTGGPLVLELRETPDIVATLAAEKRPDQWVVGFALETEDHRLRALAKLERKSCDLIVVNGESAIGAAENSVELLDRSGAVLSSLAGPKDEVARRLFAIIEQRLIDGDS
jgi:phosphopantothenoylcysteine decarboxylase/phosphopantothenate--cysteine ligase